MSEDGPIFRAAIALDERKESFGLGADVGGEVDRDAARMLYVGLELDPDELFELAGRAVAAARRLVAAHGPEAIPEVIAGILCDGVAIGLLLAEQRRRVEVAAIHDERSAE